MAPAPNPIVADLSLVEFGFQRRPIDMASVSECRNASWRRDRTSPSSGAASRTVTSWPFRASATAAARPPSPAPTTIMRNWIGFRWCEASNLDLSSRRRKFKLRVGYEVPWSHCQRRLRKKRRKEMCYRLGETAAQSSQFRFRSLAVLIRLRFTCHDCLARTSLEQDGLCDILSRVQCLSHEPG